MSEQMEPSIGEVYRLCERIEGAVKEQNGRVRKLEQDAVRIKTLWTVGVFVGGIGIDWVRHKLGL